MHLSAVVVGLMMNVLGSWFEHWTSNQTTATQYNLGLTNKYGLLTKCEVKMAGYWPSSFFACLWTETESRSINTQISSHWSMKDLLYGFRGNFSSGTRWVVSSGQDSSILPALAANQCRI